MDFRPYQLEGVSKALNSVKTRHILMWATSAGKTLAAIEFARRLRAERVLVVCPAIARGTWMAEFHKWWREASPWPIKYGLKRKTGLSKAQVKERDLAYQAEIKIVSYGLLNQVPENYYDCIIIDEAHALRSPLSRQSKTVRKIFKLNPIAPALMLTATAIPTEVKQLWNLLDTMWPGEWGIAQPTGDVSWKFMAQYCERVETEYGTAYKGSKSPAAVAALALRISPFVHRVSDAEVAPYLPPLHATALYIDEQRPVSEIAKEWLEQLPEGAQPIVVTYKRETAHQLALHHKPSVIVTGEMNPEHRLTALQYAVSKKEPVFATSESIRESISLSDFTHALILEWRTSPAQAIQLLGRFARQDAKDLTRPTFVQYVCMPGDDAKASLLSERINTVNAVLQRSEKAERIQELFKPQELTDERIEDMFASMLKNVRTVDTDEFEEIEP